jgi:hypothetical protein
LSSTTFVVESCHECELPQHATQDARLVLQAAPERQVAALGQWRQNDTPLQLLVNKLLVALQHMLWRLVVPDLAVAGTAAGVLLAAAAAAATTRCMLTRIRMVLGWCR